MAKYIRNCDYVKFIVSVESGRLNPNLKVNGKNILHHLLSRNMVDEAIIVIESVNINKDDILYSCKTLISFCKLLELYPQLLDIKDYELVRNAVRKRYEQQLVKLLSNLISYDGKSENGLQIAVREGKLEYYTIFEEFINHTKSPALFLSRDIYTVEILVNLGARSDIIDDITGNNVLHAFIANPVIKDKRYFCNYFISRGADIDYKNKQGRTPLQLAYLQRVDYKVLGELNKLLDFDKYKYSTDCEGMNILHYTLISGNYIMFVDLFNKNRLFVDMKDFNLNNILHYCLKLVDDGDKNILKIARKYNYKLYEKNLLGETPVDICVKNKKYKYLEFISEEIHDENIPPLE